MRLFSFQIILRRLPPSMTEEAFLEQVSPIPDHDHFYFAKPDPSLGNNLYCRAYINFVNVDDIYLFRDKFDGYVFLDEKGKGISRLKLDNTKTLLLQYCATFSL